MNTIPMVSDDIFFNIMGSRLCDEIVGFRQGISMHPRAAVRFTEPLVLSEDEKSRLLSDRAHWLIMDTVCMAPTDSSPEPLSRMDELVSFVKENWGTNVIVVNPRPCRYRLEDGIVFALSDFEGSSPGFPEGSRLALELARRLRCQILNVPFEPVSRDGGRFSYVPHVLGYLKEMTDMSVTRWDRRRADMLAVQAQMESDLMVSDNVMDRLTLKSIYDERMSERRYESVPEVCELLAELGDADGMGWMARLYREGHGVPPNPGMAMEWYVRASETDLGWTTEYLEYLWTMDSDFARDRMLECASACSRRGHGGSALILARACRDGNGLPQDGRKAVAWYRKAMERGERVAAGELYDLMMSLGGRYVQNAGVMIERQAVLGNPHAMVRMARASDDIADRLKWLKRACAEDGSFCAEYADLLWMQRRPEHDAELVRVLTGAGSPEAMCRLGRAYRDGRGVKADLNEAARLIRPAVGSVPWAAPELFDILWRINTPESKGEMVALCGRFPEDHAMLGRMGRAHRDARGVPKDLVKSAEYFRNAYSWNQVWGNELFDVLWWINTPESKTEMMNVIQPLVDRGDGSALGRMGRAYRDGRGVNQDLNLAAEWMRKSAGRNVGWAKNELFDILWRINTPESKEEMIKVASDFAAKGDGNAMGRMGRAYRDGRGVNQDLGIAADWMRKAISRNVWWAHHELFDILWRINTPESVKEMIDRAQQQADAGNQEMMGRMGRAYRDGRGVPKDLVKSAEWFRKALPKNIWWTNEFFDVLWAINTPESLKEMMNVIKPLVDRGDGNAMGRMGRAHRDGRGVGQDLNKAAEWMRKSAEKNVGWAKIELFDTLWRINTPQTDEEMIRVASDFAAKGDPNAMGRMGRAHRDGRGVPRDLVKSAEWFRKALPKNIWFTNELFDVLWAIETPETDAEMLRIVKPMVDRGDHGAMGRFARMHRDCRGVERNLDLAREWFIRAVDKNKVWEKELTALPPSE